MTMNDKTYMYIENDIYRTFKNFSCGTIISNDGNIVGAYSMEGGKINVYDGNFKKVDIGVDNGVVYQYFGV